MIRSKNWRLAYVAVATIAFSGVRSEAGSHLWRIQEVFSNADGTVQFIEMQECCGAMSEISLSGKWVLSVGTSTQFTFPGNLTGNTANRNLLLATAGFAALPGAPTPDYVIADNFFTMSGDTLEYWMYGAATMTFAAGALPTDGVLSLNSDGSTGTNSPTNFAGETGSIDLSGPVAIPTTSTWGLLIMAAMGLGAGGYVLSGKKYAAVAS